MGITKRGRKSFQTISNHRAASDRELNNDTRQPGTRRQSAGDIIKTQTLTTVPSHQPQHICVLELVFIEICRIIYFVFPSLTLSWVRAEKGGQVISF